MTRMLAALVLLLSAACARGTPEPAALDTRNERCRSCRMVVSDRRTAAQIVVPGEEPQFFDDLGCLRDRLGRGGPTPAHAAVFVADHRTAEWIRAERAVYGRSATVDTPMGSRLVAHASAASRAADTGVPDVVPVSAAEVLGGRAGKVQP